MDMHNTADTNDTVSPTIESTLEAFNTWRANKGEQKTIPDHLWQQIFELSKTYSISRLCQTFGINYGQYQNYIRKMEQIKKDALSEQPDVTVNFSSTVNEQPKADVQFCQVKKKQAQEKPPLLMTDTMVVELYREDGVLMKIHTTTDRFHELFYAFFSFKKVA